MTNSLNRPLLTTPTLAKHSLSLSLYHRNNIPFSIARHIASISSSSSDYLLSNLTENFDVMMDDQIDIDNGTSSSLQQQDTVADTVTDNISSNNNQQQLAPTYSNSIETSEGYHKGFLKSDYNISSNHPSIRLAFRYVKEKKSNDTVEKNGKSEEEVEDGASVDDDMADGDKSDVKKQDDKDETLYLCWINQDGIPCHFRPLNPTTINCNSDLTTHDDINGHGNLRGGASTNQSTTSDTSNNNETDTTTTNLLLVNEHDHIETTFPGHAFIFCRRVDNDTVARHTTDTSTNGNEDGSDTSNEDDNVLIVHENDRTYFVRKCNTTQDIQRETYLAVSGFRPDPMPERREDVDQEEEGKTEEEGEESESESDDDDSFDGGRELDVQLVTIRSIQNGPIAAKESPSSVGEADDSDDDDIDLPSSALGCSDCTQSVPFLRGAMNPRPPHTNAFVATAPTSNSSSNIESDSPSSLHEEDPTHNNRDAEHTLQVSVCLTRLDPTPIDTSKKHYDKVILGGWPCRIEPGCWPSDMDVQANGKNLLRSRFESDLEAASRSLPFEAREKLKSSTPIWINKSQSFGPKVAPVRGRAGCFHPGSKWLKRNGMRPDKCGGVEWYDAKHYLSDCDLWGTGGLMLHELSHAWHCLHIKDGYDNEDIINVYKAAMYEGLYDCVRVHGKQGPKCKAYACQDQMEYFAELSVAFLGTEIDEDREHNKWYPFNRRQLREHDPRAYDLLCRMWGVTADNDEQSDSGAQAPSVADRNDE